MIKDKMAMKPLFYESCCGGKGVTRVIELLKADEVYQSIDTIAYAVLLPGDSIGTHTHVHEMEAYIILKGKGLFYDNGTDIIVNPMDVTVTYSGETHAIRPVGDSTEPLEFIAVIIKE